jgi:hypothetical protein
MNRELYTQTLFGLSVEALKGLVINIRAEVSAGLMSNSEAHERINCVSAVLLTKQLEEMGVENNGMV